MTDLGRLSRRAAAGDLASARRIVAELESRERAPLAPQRWIRDYRGGEWGFVRRISNGHKVFVHRDGRVFLGDDSGHTPLEASDMNGFWQWVDPSRPAIVEVHDPAPEGYDALTAAVPVLRIPADDSPDDSASAPSPSYTSGSPLDGVLWLAAALGVPVRVISGGTDARTYRILEE